MTDFQISLLAACLIGFCVYAIGNWLWCALNEMSDEEEIP